MNLLRSEIPIDFFQKLTIGLDKDDTTFSYYPNPFFVITCPNIFFPWNTVRKKSRLHIVHEAGWLPEESTAAMTHEFLHFWLDVEEGTQASEMLDNFPRGDLMAPFPKIPRSILLKLRKKYLSGQ